MEECDWPSPGPSEKGLKFPWSGISWEGLSKLWKSCLRIPFLPPHPTPTSTLAHSCWYFSFQGLKEATFPAKNLLDLSSKPCLPEVTSAQCFWQGESEEETDIGQRGGQGQRMELAHCLEEAGVQGLLLCALHPSMHSFLHLANTCMLHVSLCQACAAGGMWHNRCGNCLLRHVARQKVMSRQLWKVPWRGHTGTLPRSISARTCQMWKLKTSCFSYVFAGVPICSRYQSLVSSLGCKYLLLISGLSINLLQFFSYMFCIFM